MADRWVRLRAGAGRLAELGVGNKAALLSRFGGPVPDAVVVPHETWSAALAGGLVADEGDGASAWTTRRG